MAHPQTRGNTQAGHFEGGVGGGAARGLAALLGRGDILAALGLSGPGDAESGEDQPPDHMHE
ncbi:hypothetical protein L537_3804 [Bordetella hinzii 1277]|nr:hypothetical protein L537_3804 [Bordetella hinzii 1277]